MLPLSGTEAWLVDWFAGRGHRLTREQNYFEAEAVDSFGVIELIEACETEFRFSFGERDFQDRRFATIAGLAEIIDGRLLKV